MKVTIKDIARETGLSLATISKYLNHKKINEKNQRRIEEAIAHLNYKPNHTAQILRSRHTMTVAILISDLGNYFWGPIISSVSQYFVKYGYTVITCSFCHDEETEIQAIQDLIVRNIDGVIMLPYNSRDNHYHLLLDQNIPVVVLDQNPGAADQIQSAVSAGTEGQARSAVNPGTRNQARSAASAGTEGPPFGAADLDSQPSFLSDGGPVSKYRPVDCVISDNYKGGAMLGRYLLEKGHKRVHILDHASYSTPVYQRIRGFQDAFGQAQTCITMSGPILFGISQKTIDLGKEHFRQIMESGDPPSAVFFTNYLSAMGGLIESSACGYSIPEDVSVVTFDDDPLFSSMYPPITSVAQDLSRIGEQASGILYRRIQGDYSDFPLTECIDVHFQERQSVKDLGLTDRS